MFRPQECLRQKVVSNNNVQASGTLKEKGGKVHISSEDFIGVSAELSTTWDTQIKTGSDIDVDADITRLTMKKLDIVY